MERTATRSSSWQRFKGIGAAPDLGPDVYRPRARFAAQTKAHPYDPDPEPVRAAALLERTTRLDRDYYALLGVEREATQEEIERAYRSEARRIHPDRYHADPERRRAMEERMRSLNVAIEVLRDPERRAQYDAAWRWA